MDKTIRIIGKAIKDASEYLPIRNRAAALATKAPPKNYLEQLKQVFNDFVKRWRYVKDIHGKELIVTNPEQIFHLVMGGKSEDPGVGFGLGAGDCDDATVAIGAQLKSIGFPVRMATMAPTIAPPGDLMNHIFIQAAVPGIGWMTVDPVVYPHHGLGWTPPNSRLAFYNLEGRLIGKQGNFKKRRQPMYQGYDGLGDVPPTNYWRDYAGFGEFTEGEPDDFRVYGIRDFGSLAEYMGITDLGDCPAPGFVAEVDVDENGRSWTPALELSEDDYKYCKRAGSPYHGMLALGDNAEQYIYDGGLGFFRKLWGRIKRGVKTVVRKAKSIGKRLISRIPGGKYLMKFGKKLWKISKKYIKPLVKFVGKWAPRLAPVAALIPGVGPAIAAAMYTSGRVAKLMSKYGVKVKNYAGGKVSKLKFPSGKSAKRFKRALKKSARMVKRRSKRRGRIKSRSMRDLLRKIRAKRSSSPSFIRKPMRSVRRFSRRAARAY
jgi:hypothetical protein